MTALLLGFVLFIVSAVAQTSRNVSLIGRWPDGPNLTSFVVGNIAYIGNGGGMDILDISNPQAPIRLGRAITPGEEFTEK